MQLIYNTFSKISVSDYFLITNCTYSVHEGTATGFFMTMCKLLIAKNVCKNVFVFVSNFVLGNFIYNIKKKMEDGERTCSDGLASMMQCLQFTIMLISILSGNQ